MKKSSLPMAALFQKEKVFLIGLSHCICSTFVKILGSFHFVIITRGSKNVQQKMVYVNYEHQLIKSDKNLARFSSPVTTIPSFTSILSSSGSVEIGSSVFSFKCNPFWPSS